MVLAVFNVPARRISPERSRVVPNPRRSGTSIIQVSGIPLKKFRVARRKKYVVRRPYERKTFAVIPSRKGPNNRARRQKRKCRLFEQAGGPSYDGGYARQTIWRMIEISFFA
jgi:hypothetical protein